MPQSVSVELAEPVESYGYTKTITWKYICIYYNRITKQIPSSQFPISSSQF
ncbi:MAG: hypothetical protein F6K41_13155 [Symploca sp. SIO3E6]|nr:hypothetical protein [Caldora sp. SIO3E6]